MTTTLAPRHEAPAAVPTQGALIRKEIGRYARHPVFLIGVGLLALTMLQAPDPQESTLGILIFPAAAIGLFGLITMASLTRSSDQVADTAGAVATGQRARTMALVSAIVVAATCSCSASAACSSRCCATTSARAVGCSVRSGWLPSWPSSPALLR